MSSRYSGFGSRHEENDSTEDFVSIGTHFDPAEPTNSTSILATLGRKASKLVDLSSSNYGYDGKRFHGAFTGGFNAGFYNTVGSVEGWRPSEFKSSRSERAGKRSYEPEDFMDKGDFSEHGINPKQIKIRSTFDQNEAHTRSTPKPSEASSQRTNDDVLREMIRVKALSIGKKILMSMGWKPGEGVGVKLSRQHRQRLKRSLMQEAPKVRSLSPPRVEEMDVPSVKVYGVALPPPSFQQYSARASRLDDEDDEDERDEQLYANVNLPPLDYEVHFQLQKQDHHGIGYKPLESLNLFGRDNLFAQPSVTKQINNVKIQGHAFGVGIEEDEDDKDLFAVDDLKQYDYELTTGNDDATDVMRQKTQQNNFVLKFVRYESMSMAVNYTPPLLPVDFRAGHRFPKSAMPPVPAMLPSNEQVKPVSTQLNANTRGLLLGDLSFLSCPPPTSKAPLSTLPPPPPSVPSEPKVEATPPPKPVASLEWDVEHERSAKTTPTAPSNSARTQFLDAVKNRFVSSSDHEQLTERQSMEAAFESDLKKAVAMNLYGSLTRSTQDWKPNPLLCKRMNMPNPYSDDAYEDTKESKKSRRQLCSNLFEHFFTQSTAEIVPTPENQPSGLSTGETVPSANPTDSSKPVPPVVRKPSAPPPLAAPKFEFAPIESFDKENQERPPLDFFSAIFDNQDSEDEEEEELKNAEMRKLVETKSSIVRAPPPPPPPMPPVRQPITLDSDHSDSSDSSIEVLSVRDKSSVAYGPAIPASLPTERKVDHDSSIWTKLATTGEMYEEVKQKKHKKKKKHHKKSKKHHHES